MNSIYWKKEIVVWVRKDWSKFWQEDVLNLPADTEYVSLQRISYEQYRALKDNTACSVRDILSYYI